MKSNKSNTYKESYADDSSTAPIDLKERHKLLSGNPEEGKPIVLRQSIRINTLKGREEEIAQRIEKRGIRLEKIPFLKCGYWVIAGDAHFSLAATQEHLLGLFYIQEAASQIAVEWLNPLPGELVLDCCASPGGKTSQIAQLMMNKGTIVACDVGRKTVALQNNLERLGVTNTMVYTSDARFFTLPSSFTAPSSISAPIKADMKADKILVDAPCSGNYAIEAQWYRKRTINDIRACARMQKEILAAAIHNLKKGGTLVYSTCSLEPEEDEDIVLWAGKNFDMTVLRTRKIWPGKENMQGMFVSEITI